MADVIPAPPVPRVPVRGGGTFPVHRIYCVGRNFAEHAREMGATPADPAARGTPVLFCKPADAIVVDGEVAYPPGTADLHHEVELVIALGQDAPPGVLDRTAAQALVFGCTVGLDLTRRDLQAVAKAKGQPWDAGKAFDASAPIGELVPIAHAVALSTLELTLDVDGQRRQHGRLDDLIWDVPDILVELSRLFALKAGDLVFMGTPAGVGPLAPGQAFDARLGPDLVQLQGRMLPIAG